MAEYVLTIRNGTGVDGEESAPNSPSPENVSEQSEKTPSKKGVALSAIGIAKRALTTVVSYQIRTTTLRTGQEETQQKYQAAYNMINGSIDIVSSIAYGAMIGNLPGAIIGAAVGTAFQLVDVAQKLDQYATEKRVEAIGLHFANIRAGVGRDANYGY
jgi:hypothetical protein